MSTTAEERRRAMLKTAMGPAIAEALSDPAVIEVMVNPDGRLWIDRLGEGRSDAGLRVHPSETERIIRLVASHVRAEVHADNPIVSAELPSGERFEGVLPPVALAPCFAIRKPAAKIFTLADYVRAQIMVPIQAEALRQAVRERINILVAGGTSSGKTTLANALLAEIANRDERVILIEDTRELQCAAADCVALRTRRGVVSLADLVRSTLRLRPDRIIVGEVRGAEALDMLKAWNTGHPGGIATVHANSAHAALYRIEQLVQESVTVIPRRLIAEAKLDPAQTSNGTFVAPMAFNIDGIESMETEQFGPLLHIVRYRADQLEAVIDSINAKGYGLTFGVHSRNENFTNHVASRIRVGNVYVNRDIIGAVVGVQPFGGQGFSGTGPKAGGPHYLLRFATEKTRTINTAALGGNASLLAMGDE